MTWVKVCGLRSEADVAAAVAAGADAVGFVNVPGSPRYVTIDEVARLTRDVPITSVLLTKDVPADEILTVLRDSGASGLQPYGAERLEAARVAAAAGFVVLVPIKAKAGLDLADVPGIPLIDTPAVDALGGTGRTFDWSLVDDVRERFVLAGGLGPDNVGTAVARVDPWGVDASSGLEGSPGHKDHGMVANFIKKAKTRETR